MSPKRSIYRAGTFVAAFGLLFAGAWWEGAGAAQDQLPDLELVSTARLFPDIGTGLRAIHRDSRGRYYVLSRSAPAVFIYSAQGKRLGQIPAHPTHETSLLAGVDFDLGTNGFLYVTDQGANNVKIFDDDGRLMQVIAVTDPESVAALPNGQLAVAGLQSNKLVEVLDQSGTQVREFGDRENLATRREMNHSLNAGRLLADPSGHVYYAFTFLPEPTVRKYDLSGKNSLEISLQTIEFYPTAVSTRRKISENEEEDRHGNLVLHPVINAFGVDPQTFDVWIAMDDELAHFDREGNRVGATYRTFSAEDERIVPTSILVEPERLIVAADPMGVYVFPRPDKAPGVQASAPVAPATRVSGPDPTPPMTETPTPAPK